MPSSTENSGGISLILQLLVTGLVAGVTSYFGASVLDREVLHIRDKGTASPTSSVSKPHTTLATVSHKPSGSSQAPNLFQTGSSPSSLASASQSGTPSAVSVAPPSNVAPKSSVSNAVVVPPPAASSATVSIPAPVAKAPPSGDANTCLANLLAPETFLPTQSPSLASVCEETDPRVGAAKIMEQVVLGGKGRSVTVAMREWAMMGWYELATFTVMRAQCCPQAKPITLPLSGTCPSMSDALDNLGKTSLSVKKSSDAILKTALSEYTKSLFCLIRSGGAYAFLMKHPIQGGQENAFYTAMVHIFDKP
jgi:eukaryotic-like serine/threonine-protein kinase